MLPIRESCYWLARITPVFGALEHGRVIYGLGDVGHGLGTRRLRIGFSS
jgi:hypothetical protein